MTDKNKFGQVGKYQGSTARHGWRDRLLDICEHLLVLIVFLVFLSFVQSVTATQQELDPNVRGQQTSSTVEKISPGNMHGRIFGQQSIRSDHARA